MRTTKRRVDPNAVLKAAASAGMRDVIVIGIDAKGLPYYASSIGYVPRINGLVEGFAQTVKAS